MNREQMANYRAMLQELLDLEHGLSEKEIAFLDSLHEWQGDFTPKQVGWLDRIYERMLGA